MSDNIDPNSIAPSSSADETESLVTPTPSKKLIIRKQALEAEKGKMQIQIINEEEGGNGKKSWSENEVITLLKVLKTISNKSDMSRLYGLVKTDISDVSKVQVSEKVRRIKKKFIKSLEKGIPLPPSLSSKLCQEIWGGGGGGDDADIYINSPSPHMEPEDFQARYPQTDNSIDSFYPYKYMKKDGSGGKDFIRNSIVFVPPNELEELEDEWDNYHEEELESVTRHKELKRKQLKLLQRAKQIYKDIHGN